MLGGIFEKNKISKKIKEHNNLISTIGFWKDKSFAQKILKEKKFFENITDNFNLNVNEFENLQELITLHTMKIMLISFEKFMIRLLKQLLEINGKFILD